MAQQHKHGFVLGKFMPLHAGHIYLIESAQDQCEKLTVFLCSQPDDPIPGEVRRSWLRQTFPEVNVVHHPDPLPRDQTDPNFWDLWRESIREYCPKEKFDIVFSSESYGDRLAQELEAEHVCVDIDRKEFPVSGTDIRNDPSLYWQFIPAIVRPYYEDVQ